MRKRKISCLSRRKEMETMRAYHFATLEQMLEVKTQRKRKIKLGDEEEFKVNTFLLVIEGKKLLL